VLKTFSSKGIWSESSNNKYRYSAHTCDQLFVLSCQSILTQGLSEPESLHPIQLFRRDDLNVLDAREAAVLDQTVLDECLEDSPAPLTIDLIAGGTVSEKERFDRFGSQDISGIYEGSASFMAVSMVSSSPERVQRTVRA